MTPHALGLRVDDLVYAQMRAKSTGNNVSLVDDACHMVVMVDARGHVTIRPEGDEVSAMLWGDHDWAVDDDWAECRLCHDCNNTWCCTPRTGCPKRADHDNGLFGAWRCRWMRLKWHAGRLARHVYWRFEWYVIAGLLFFLAYGAYRSI